MTLLSMLAALLAGAVGVPAPSGAVDLLGPSPCRPHPYEDCGESTFDVGPSSAWGFDDSRYCPNGPGDSCFVPNRYPEDPRPGNGFVPAEGCVFEMYVVAGCGTELHLPLCDVETATIRVKDPLGGGVRLRAQNDLVTGKRCVPSAALPDLPFDEEGIELSWRVGDCKAVAGGPGNRALMDVWFTGEEDTLPGSALCGVYTVEFESWGGCGWELHANCDGTNGPQFLIYDDLCEAETAFTPLSELVLTGLQVFPGADRCTVSYCLDVENVGCAEAGAFEVLVREGVSWNTEATEVASLPAGGSQRLCGTIPVDSHGVHHVTVPVAARVDPADEVAECTESPAGSGCIPASGAESLEGTADVECNRPPVCVAGGPYLAECAGAVTGVALDGTGSFDPDGDALTWRWETDCSGAIRDLAASRTVLDFDSRALGCSRSCLVTLTVSDGEFDVPCAAEMTVEDTTPPAIEQMDFDGRCLWPPNHGYACLSEVPSHVRATDVCDPAPLVRVEACSSSQPDEAPDEHMPGENGDGNTTQDCVLAPDGLSFCARSERLGSDPQGRTYTLEVRAYDACGNATSAFPALQVPHDQSPQSKDCLHSEPAARR